jgi:VWFA-related protein
VVRLLALIIAACTVAGTSPAQQAVFRSGTRAVPVHATVTGADGRLITDLTREAFTILDNGRPQPITEFDAGIQPISIVIMLDMSGSMSGNLARLRNAAVQMFTRLLPADRARVGNFGDRIRLSPAFTNDVDTLIRTLWLDLQPGGPTPLWGAIHVSMNALANVTGRRVVLVLSDGHDTGRQSREQYREIVQRAQVEDFMIYAIGMRGSGGFRGMRTEEPDPGLSRLALESGGGYFELRESDDLGAVFARVADELHRQYLLGFHPPEADGKLHELEVRIDQPGVSVRARRSYQAPRPGR